MLAEEGCESERSRTVAVVARDGRHPRPMSFRRPDHTQAAIAPLNLLAFHVVSPRPRGNAQNVPPYSRDGGVVIFLALRLLARAWV